MYLRIIDVKPLEDYRLLLTFSNGEKRKFNMYPYLNTGIFRELKDKELFNTVHIRFDTIEWANEADFDPEALYQNSTAVEKSRG